MANPANVVYFTEKLLESIEPLPGVTAWALFEGMASN